MEEHLKTRLKIRTDKLAEVAATAKHLLEAPVVDRDDVIRTHSILKTVVLGFSNELNYVTEKGGADIPDIEQGLNMQIDAEILVAEMDCLLETVKAQDKTERPSNSASTKLPRMDLPKFDGNPLKFTQFWDQFKSSVHDKNMADSEKFNYLWACVQDEAYKTIEGLTTTNLNYTIAVEKLKSRFGNRDLVVESHYNALSAIPCAKDSANECRKTLNELETHIRILSSMGEDVTNNQLGVTIRKKFPQKVMYQVNLMNPENIEKLRGSLEQVITAMERSERSMENLIIEPLPSTSATSTEALTAVAKKVNTRERRDTVRRGIKRKQYDRSVINQNKKKRKSSCIFCDGDHFNSNCEVVKTVEERKKRLKNRCFLCLREGHRANKCKNIKPCYYCKEKTHNQALCPKSMIKRNIISKYTPCNILHSLTSQIFLQTAVTQIRAKENCSNKTPCRALLDSGSQRSYLTSRIATKLNLEIKGEDLLLIYTFGSDKPKETVSQWAEIIVETKRGVERKICVNIVPSITDSVPVMTAITDRRVDVLADDHTLDDKVDLLIGNDFYFSFIRGCHIKLKEHFFLIDTDFGWIPSGSMDNGSEEENTFSMITYCQCHVPMCPYITEPDLPLRDTDIKFLWALENIGITDSPKTTREEQAVKFFNDTVVYHDSRYHVKWPWAEYPPELPTNYGLAYGRLKGLLKRLDAKTLQEYDEIIQEQLKAGIIEVINMKPNQSDQAVPVHYLPHHIVRQEGKKGRIVYDGSAKLKEQKSLNECLYAGPSMLKDLTGLLLKFRINKIGILADVEKAFLQIGLQEDDREVTRFLWLKEPAQNLSEDNLLQLRFKRLAFGVISSPFILTATIRHHLLTKEDPLLRNLADKIYVDNLVFGADSTSEAVELYQKTRRVFQELSMNIREWTLNDENFNNSIPEELSNKDKEQVKLLGLMWNIKKDTLSLNLKENVFNNTKKTTTKKEILRTIASFYDPCGFAAPLILPAKLLLQELWKRKVKWDSPIPDDLIGTWKASMESILLGKDIVIPRYVSCEHKDKGQVEYNLHCFTDASKHAYASVVYLTCKQGNETKSTLVMSKLRITPLEDKNDLKIPRLELLGYLIGSRLLKYVKANLGLQITNQYLWTDSMIILSWIKSNKLLPPFVSRRVLEIKQNSDVDWRYVNTEQNPADIATRPDMWSNKKEMWFKGPDFLLYPKHTWPHLPDRHESVLQSVAEGLVNKPDLNVKTFEEDISNAENLNKDRKSTVTKIKEIQKEHFPDEVAGKETSLKKNLRLFLDVDGVLRCQGRMTHTDWSYDKRYPILIPTSSSFTRNIIRETHERNYHVGVTQTLSLIRQKYWIVKGRAQVQKMLKICKQCIKHGGGPYKLPGTPVLPSERVNFSAPFQCVGVDYFGPIQVCGDTGDIKKRWVCLYTCLAVRAVHMEIVNDLSASECLLALRRFVSSRGAPAVVVSDNALQFKLVSEVLLNSYCKEKKIEWRFIPELAPWHGGFYERLVGVVKRCLKRSLEKHLLNDNQLLTVIKEVEAVVNTRPLTYVGSEEPEHVLSPADFLSLGQCLELKPAEGVLEGGTSTRQELIAGWKRGLRLMNEFRRMFSEQYLSSLRERYTHCPRETRVKSNRKPKVGDVVQIKGESKNRENWRVGTIVKLIEGADEACRVAHVKVGDKEFRRSINHLYPLEVDEHNVIKPSEHSMDAETDSFDNLNQQRPENKKLPKEDLPENSMSVETDLETNSPKEDLPENSMSVETDLETNSPKEDLLENPISTEHDEETSLEMDISENESHKVGSVESGHLNPIEDQTSESAAVRPHREASRKAREKIKERVI